MVRELIFQLFGKEAVEMVESIAFARKTTFINGVVVFFLDLPPGFGPLRSRTDRLLFIIIAFFQADPTLEPIVFAFAVYTLLLIAFGLSPFLEIHAQLVQLIALRHIL